MPETAGTASNGEHLEDSAPRPETGTHGADSGEEGDMGVGEAVWLEAPSIVHPHGLPGHLCRLEVDAPPWAGLLFGVGAG